jgi:hypothetical protein
MIQFIKLELIRRLKISNVELVKLRGGGNAKVLFFAFFNNNRQPSLLLKTSCFREGNFLIKSEFDKLRSVKSVLPEDLKRTIPKQYGLLNINGYLVSSEEAVLGRQAGFDLSGDDLKKVFNWLCVFHRANILKQKEVNQNSLIEFLGKYGRKAEEAVDFVRKNWKFGNIKIPLIKQHSDFHFANVFFQNIGLKVVDWGNYGNVVFPAYDLIFFLRRQKKELTPDSEFLLEYFRRFSIPHAIIPFWIDFSVIVENLEKWLIKK